MICYIHDNTGELIKGELIFNILVEILSYPYELKSF